MINEQTEASRTVWTWISGLRQRLSWMQGEQTQSCWQARGQASGPVAPTAARSSPQMGSTARKVTPISSVLTLSSERWWALMDFPPFFPALINFNSSTGAVQDVPWSLCALYLLACQVIVIVGDSGACHLYNSCYTYDIWRALLIMFVCCLNFSFVRCWFTHQTDGTQNASSLHWPSNTPNPIKQSGREKKQGYKRILSFTLNHIISPSDSKTLPALGEKKKRKKEVIFKVNLWVSFLAPPSPLPSNPNIQIIHPTTWGFMHTNLSTPPAVNLLWVHW